MPEPDAPVSLRGRYARAWISLLGSVLAGGLVCGCGTGATSADSAARGSEWVESSHGRLDDPDTAKAFPDSVRTLAITFSESDWKRIASGLLTVCGAFNSGSPKCTGSSLDSTWVDSTWFQADIAADGQTWKHVGIRLKANSDLAKAWGTGSYCFPFHIKMDKWEDAFPAIDNQRFYGFQKLDLSNLNSDASLVRHHVASSFLRAAKVPSPMDGFALVKIYGGDTLRSTGVCSLRESVDWPLAKRWFSSSGGDIYQSTSSFHGGYAAVRPGLTLESGSGYGDVKSMVLALDSAVRTTNPAAWRSGLEASFDVHAFLRWLAANTAVANTDGYGYKKGSGSYLYDKGGVLEWITWELDASFPSSRRTDGIWYPSAADTNWPLVTRLLSDTAYCDEYRADMQGFSTGGADMVSTDLQARIAAALGVLTGAGVATAANAAEIAALKNWAADRQAAIDSSVSAHTCPYAR